MRTLLSCRRRQGLAVVWLMALCAGCTRSPAQPAPPAAEKPKAESDLSHTTLSAEAVRSLGIRSEPIRTQPVQEHTQLTGWVMAKQGHEVTVTAPVAGYVREPADAKGCPVPGVAVSQGQQLLSLEPVLSPVEQIQWRRSSAVWRASWRRPVKG
jgi:hypothetical protein